MNGSLSHLTWLSQSYPSYPDYSSSYQDLTPVGPDLLRTGTAHYYYHSQQAWTTPTTNHWALPGLIWGEYSIYNGHGHMVSLGVNHQVAAETVKELRQYDWLDRATRAVIVDFTVYNPNTNVYGTVLVVTEFLPVGGVATRWSVNVIKPFGSDLLTYYSYACLVGLVVLLCVGVFTETLHLLCQGWDHFRSKPERLTSCLVLLMIFVLLVSFTVRWYVMEDAVRQAMAARKSSFRGSLSDHLEPAALADVTYRTALGLLNFSVILRLLVLSRVLAIMSKMMVTLHSLLRELLPCMPYLLCLLMAYASFFHLQLGRYIHALSTLPKATLEVISMATGASSTPYYSNINVIHTGVVFASFAISVHVVSFSLITGVVLNTYHLLVSAATFNHYQHKMTDAALSDLLMSAAPQGHSFSTKSEVRTQDAGDKEENNPDSHSKNDIKDQTEELDQLKEEFTGIDMTSIYPEKYP